MTDKAINIGGQISDCAPLSHICSFDCCNQDSPSEPPRPESSILLYPGEIEAITTERKRHITITLDDFNGGKLGYCNPAILNQATCNPENNFKPLDCQSYPFAPAFGGGSLILLVDRKRCPLGLGALRTHYESILEKWREAIQKNSYVRQWIESLDLNGYEEFNY
ncbi:MAG: hypothetical protein ABIH78_00755 [Candidatus Peregrinibacteria bacterium]